MFRKGLLPPYPEHWLKGWTTFLRLLSIPWRWPQILLKRWNLYSKLHGVTPEESTIWIHSGVKNSKSHKKIKGCYPIHSKPKGSFLSQKFSPNLIFPTINSLTYVNNTVHSNITTPCISVSNVCTISGTYLSNIQWPTLVYADKRTPQIDILYNHNLIQWITIAYKA